MSGPQCEIRVITTAEYRHEATKCTDATKIPSNVTTTREMLKRIEITPRRPASATPNVTTKISPNGAGRADATNIDTTPRHDAMTKNGCSCLEYLSRIPSPRHECQQHVTKYNVCFNVIEMNTNHTKMTTTYRATSQCRHAAAHNMRRTARPPRHECRQEVNND